MLNDPDDICLWPDGSYCARSELEEFQQGKSDDFEVIPYGTDRWSEVCEEV